MPGRLHVSSLRGLGVVCQGQVLTQLLDGLVHGGLLRRCLAGQRRNSRRPPKASQRRTWRCCRLNRREAASSKRAVAVLTREAVVLTREAAVLTREARALDRQVRRRFVHVGALSGQDNLLDLPSR